MAHRPLTAGSQPWLHNGITRRTLGTTDRWCLNPTESDQEHGLDTEILKRSRVVFMYRKVWEQLPYITGPSHHYDLPLCFSVDSLQPQQAFFEHSKHTHTYCTHFARDAWLTSFRALLQCHLICETFLDHPIQQSSLTSHPGLFFSNTLSPPETLLCLLIHCSYICLPLECKFYEGRDYVCSTHCCIPWLRTMPGI